MNSAKLVIELAFVVALLGIAMATSAQDKPEPTDAERTAKVQFAQLHKGRITNKLYGGFIELIDDLVPGMWAELLNDRGFEGVTPAADWCYNLGELTMCDRQWELNPQCSYETSAPFNGKRSVVLAPGKKPASILQRQITIKKGMHYDFTGNFKGDAGVKVTITAKVELPDGTWMTLGQAELPPATKDWSKLRASFTGKGTTMAAVFEITATGKGSVSMDKISLMPGDNVMGWRADVVKAIKEAKMGVIRWGGSLQEFGYKWKSSVGDRDHRAPFDNRYWGRMETNDVGMDEFVQFCELVGAEPLMCTSFEDGVESSRELVEYLNGSTDTKWGKERAKNGRVKPYKVKYWQLGNEQWGEDYAKKVLEYCKAVKEQDPSVHIIASDISPLLLEKAGKYIDTVCRHYYFMADNAACESVMAEDRKTVADAKLGKDVDLAITEWNTTAGDWGLNRSRMVTLQNALHGSRFMNLLQRNSDFATIANRSNMTNCFCSGYIKTDGLTVLKTPAYWALKVYADHYKPVPVGIEMPYKEIDFSACRTEDGSKLTIFAVNPTDKARAITLDLTKYSGFEVVGGEMMADRFDRHQPEVMNHWASPDRVCVLPIKYSGKKVTLPAYSVVAIECAKKG